VRWGKEEARCKVHYQYTLRWIPWVIPAVSQPPSELSNPFSAGRVGDRSGRELPAGRGKRNGAVSLQRSCWRGACFRSDTSSWGRALRSAGAGGMCRMWAPPAYQWTRMVWVVGWMLSMAQITRTRRTGLQLRKRSQPEVADEERTPTLRVWHGADLGEGWRQTAPPDA